MHTVTVAGRSTVRALGLVGVLSLGAAATGAAQDITIGNRTQVNNFPFQQYEVTPPNRYQQIYAGSAFGPSAIFLDALRFHTVMNPGTGFAAGEYLVRFSTTTLSVDGLSTDYDSNLGLDTHVFFSGLLSGGARIAGSTYTFDPLLGNLLLDVTVLSQTRAFTGGFDVDTETGDEMSRVVQFNAGGDALPAVDSQGLVTTFETRPATATVPEPISTALLATGLVGIAAARRRRRLTAD